MNFNRSEKISPAPRSTGPTAGWYQAWAWAAGLGIFGGSLAGYLLQTLLQNREILGSLWPALLTLGGSGLLAAWLFPAGRYQAGLTAPGLILISVLAATGLRDSSGDGLGSYAETLHWLAQKPNCPEGIEEKRDFLAPASAVRGSLSFGCIFVNVSGSFESAKWTGWAWCLGGALMLIAGGSPLPGRFPFTAVCFLLVLLQPVFLYQGATLYQDFQTAGAMTAVFGSFLAIQQRLPSLPWLGLIITLLCLGLSKTFAVGYAFGLMLLFLPPIFFRAHPRLIQIVAGITVIAAWIAPLTLPFLREIRANQNEKNLTGQAVTKLLLFVDPVIIDAQGKDGIHGGCGEVVSNSGVMFWRRHFSASKRGAEEVKAKPPFWFTRPELDVFADLTPDLRFGGYGPLYGTAVFLALIPGLLLMTSASSLQAGWKWILVACLVMVPISPSWWARWFPQGWWIPLAACVGFLCGAPDWRAKFKWVGWLARFGLLALGLNSLLIFVFTAKGYFEAEAIIRRQLTFLKTLPAPVEIETGYFTATRFWLDQEKIPYRQKNIPPDAASLVMYRTTLKIQLTEGDLERLRKDPDHFKSLQKHKLLNLPRPSQPSA